VELRTLRYFVAVVEHGSVTAAADAVHITQPSLSRQLHAFEKQLGLRLFERRDNRLAVTAAGRHFLPVAKDLLAHADRAAQAAATLAAGRLETVTLSAPGTTLTDVVAPFLATWDSGDPLPFVHAESPPAIYESLARGADLAVGTEPPPEHLASRPVAVLPVWAYVPPTHPWGSRSRVSLRELVGEDLLVLAPDQHARRALDHAVGTAGLGYTPAREFATPEVAQAVAASGRGVAVVSDDRRFDLVPLEIADGRDRLVIRLYGAWEPAHHAAEVLSELTARLSAFCVAKYGRRAAP